MPAVISILEENEIDVLVRCSCGLRYYFYLTDTYYQCECGKIYTAHIHIVEHDSREGSWVLTPHPIADLYENAGDEDVEE